MTAALEQTPTDLEHLVELAQRGEEVVLTKAGLPVAKITAMTARRNLPTPSEVERRRKWLEDLAAHAQRADTGKTGGPTTEQIIDEIREERI